MAGPCVSDTDCIALNVDAGTGVLLAQPILSPDVGNTLECRANGLFAGPAQSQVTALAGSVIRLNLTTGSGEVVLQTASLTITNPSATRTGRYLALFDCGSMDFNAVEPLAVMSLNIYKRVAPAAFALTRRFTMANSSSLFSTRSEDAAACIPFSGSLAPSASVTLEVRRTAQMVSAPSGSTTGDLALGDIQAHGWVIA